MNYKIKILPFVESIIILILMIQTILQNIIPQLQYIDELFAVVLLIKMFGILFTKKVDKKIFKELSLMFALLLVGITNTLMFKIQTIPSAIITDIGNLFKAYIGFYAYYIIYKDRSREYKDALIHYLTIFCKLIIIPGFFLSIINLFMDIGMHTDYVYGIRSFHYIFLRVGNLYSFCVLSIIILTLELRKNSNKNNIICIFFTLFLMIATLRTRAFVYAILYVIIYNFQIKKKKVKVKPLYIIIFVVIAAYVAFPKISFYFLENSNRARSALLRYGLVIMKEYFPFGTGFATYGTFAAKKYYSLLYYKYGMNNLYGLSVENGDFLMDNYWPAIFAEFGIIGTIILAFILLNILKRCLNNDAICKSAALFGMLSMLIASIATGSFFGVTSTITMAIIAIAATFAEEGKGEKNNEKS